MHHSCAAWVESRSAVATLSTWSHGTQSHCLHLLFLGGPWLAILVFSWVPCSVTYLAVSFEIKKKREQLNIMPPRGGDQETIMVDVNQKISMQIQEHLDDILQCPAFANIRNLDPLPIDATSEFSSSLVTGGQHPIVITAQRTTLETTPAPPKRMDECPIKNQRYQNQNGASCFKEGQLRNIPNPIQEPFDPEKFLIAVASTAQKSYGPIGANIMWASTTPISPGVPLNQASLEKLQEELYPNPGQSNKKVLHFGVLPAENPMEMKGSLRLLSPDSG